ncbi:hypothetical protein SVIO_052930 [Streptomyces violaceusniger]|uniref:Uncharacterized protein n=1 Tax=Streptomyces violaceusniger TaxID=68280 RepID=A0A4D4L6M8_STRVO|nr:hypothetical protein SVIO_052930 [Streptomyces violaceusniger]
MLMDNPWPTVATVVTVGVLRLMGDVIRWLAARSGERLRARTLAELVNRTEPGTVLTDRRPDGAALTIRRRPEGRGSGASGTGGVTGASGTGGASRATGATGTGRSGGDRGE